MSKRFLLILTFGLYCTAVGGGKNILHAQQLEIDCQALLKDCEWNKCESYENVSMEAAHICGQEFRRSGHRAACEAGCGFLQSNDLCTITDCLGNQAPWQYHKKRQIDTPGWQ